jgi:choline dehydrogenase
MPTIRRMASGFRQCWRLLRETAFSERIAEIPVWTDELVRSDALESALRRATGTAYHPVATARMGKRDDEGALVDEQCRVYGIENLRVVDASVMPSIPRANTNLPCIMIAERMADQMRT